MRQETNFKNQCALVTGANRGIGLALCKHLSEQEANVIAVCRTPSEELEGLQTSIERGVNLNDSASLVHLQHRLKNRSIDYIFHCAGVFDWDCFESFSETAIRNQFETNALAPLILTRLLLSNFSADTKIIVITSAAGSLTANQAGGQYGYRMSKAAANVVGVALAHDLESKGITVMLIHPGTVATRMTNFQGTSTEFAARSITALAAHVDIGLSGRFWNIDGSELPW